MHHIHGGVVPITKYYLIFPSTNYKLIQSINNTAATQMTTEVICSFMPDSACNIQMGTALAITATFKGPLYGYKGERLFICGWRTLSLWHNLSHLMI